MIAHADNRHPLELLAGELAETWANHAKILREHHDLGAAAAYDRAAEDLHRGVSQYLDEELDVPAIAEESGYHPVHVVRLIENGKLPVANTAEKTVRRRDLPRKPGHGIIAPEVARTLPSRSQVVRSIASGER